MRAILNLNEVTAMNVQLLTALSKLVVAGEQAGFSVDELIRLLNAGIGMEDILNLIALRLERREAGTVATRWIM